jgi:DNA gyrase subunit A
MTDQNPDDGLSTDDLAAEMPEESTEKSETENTEVEPIILDPAEPGMGNIDIVDDMEQSFLSYAMSVIVSRALPDVRDGLKPVHRRILYAMLENGLRSGAKYRKSATVVGAVLGKYHPHGDTAVYMSMVRMAQNFSLRYPLVNGQGNFGSIDGDNPAAMRYTEAKMTKIAETMIEDIEKKTIDFKPNYDATAQEPSVLPSVLPQLLLNGTMGIAVGMATNIPPHNLNELVDATVHLLRNPEATITDLLTYIKGPDFPTSAEIYDGGAISEMYHTGRGRVIMRAKTTMEEYKKDRYAIIVHEIPYQVNKAELIIKMADLVKSKKIEDISDIRDESNRKGIRVVIELKRDAFPKKVLNKLFKFTALQKSFSLNMIALVDGIHPRLLNLKEVLEYFITHRFEVIQRRTQHDLDVAKARAHILEGLKIALDNIDSVIEIIRGSETKELAAINLQSQFGLSEKQTKAILEMRLQTLAGLERTKIENELAEKLAKMDELTKILANRELQADIIEESMVEAKNKFGDERRTIVHPNELGKFSAKDTIPDEEMLVVMTRKNYIKRMNPSVFRTQKRGGVGVVGVKTKDADTICKARFGTNHNDLLFFTSIGRVFSLPMYEVPEASRTAKGTPIVNLLQLQPGETVTEIMNLSRSIGEHIFFCTTGGTVKRTSLQDFANIRRSGLIACKLKEGEKLLWAKISSGQDEVFIVTREGKSIRFPEADARVMGRSAAGVRGIKLKGDDRVVQMDLLREGDAKLLVVMENGLGKMTNVDQHRGQSRGGTGVKVASITKKTGKVAGARVIDKGVEGDILMVTDKGQTIRVGVADIKTSGRATQGVILMRPSKGDKVNSISFIVQKADKEEVKALAEGEEEKKEA